MVSQRPGSWRLPCSAVDRGSGKQARTQVKAAHTRLCPAEIERVRADLDVLDWEDLVPAMGDENEALADEDEVVGHEAVDDEAEDGPTAPGVSSTEAAALLARARTVLSRGIADSAALQATMGALEAAVAAGDQQRIARDSEDLLDLLYALDDA